MNPQVDGPGAGRALTRQEVLSVTKRARLEDVRTLNAWGMQLADVSVVSELPGVEVLSLSVNAIASLDSFQHAHNLRELYLRRNAISDLAQLVYLAGLPQLRVLWLADNPFASHLLPSTYRLAVLAFLPNLQKLDDQDVRPEEVEQSLLLPDPVLVDAMLRAQRMVPSWSPPLDLPVPPPSLLAASPARGTSPAPPQPTTSPPHGPRSSSSSSSQQEQGLAAGVHEGPLMPPPPPAPVSRPDKRPTEARVLSAVLLLLEELDGSSLGRVESRLQVLRRQRAQEEGRD